MRARGGGGGAFLCPLFSRDRDRNKGICHDASSYKFFPLGMEIPTPSVGSLGMVDISCAHPSHHTVCYHQGCSIMRSVKIDSTQMLTTVHGTSMSS